MINNIEMTSPPTGGKTPSTKVGNSNSRYVSERGQEYFIGDIRSVCAAGLDLNSGFKVTLFFSNSAQPLTIEFETRKRAVNFFEEVSNDIYVHQKHFASKLSSVLSNMA